MTTTDSPALIIEQLLLDNSLGVATTEKDTPWQIYIGQMPDGKETPNDIIALYDESGVKDGRLMSGPLVQHPGVQVILRTTDYKTGWAQMKLIFELFESVLRTQVVIDTITYNIQNISITSPILPLGVPDDDTKRRDLFSLNVLLTINEE